MVSNRNILFQGSIFRCHVRVREGNSINKCMTFAKWYEGRARIGARMVAKFIYTVIVSIQEMERNDCLPFKVASKKNLKINILYNSQVIQFVTFLSPNVGGHEQPFKGSRKLTTPKTQRIANIARSLDDQWWSMVNDDQLDLKLPGPKKTETIPPWPHGEMFATSWGLCFWEKFVTSEGDDHSKTLFFWYHPSPSSDVVSDTSIHQYMC